MAATRAPARRRRMVGFGDAAWIGTLVAAPIVLAAIVALGPLLGRAFLAPGDEAFWPTQAFPIRPEGTEQGRFLLAAAGPVLAVAALLLVRRAAPLSERAATVLVRVAQVGLVGVLAAALVAQRALTYSEIYSSTPPFKRVYFTIPTLAAAAVATAAIAIVLARVPPGTLRRFARERRGAAIACALVAAAATLTWLASAVILDSSAANTSSDVRSELFASLSEPWAVLNGSGPLAGFHAQYGQLWPYLVAGSMSLLGQTLGVYTVTMAAIDLAALLAVYAVLRRVVRSSLLGLALYLPFLATGFFVKAGPLSDRYAPSTLFSLWPVRYAGPYLLVWLLCRHVAGLAPRHRLALTFAGGLVVLNNPEFGLPALAATLAGLLWSRPPRDVRALARLAGETLAGLAAALAAGALLVLAVVGEPPRLLQLFEFARIYGSAGWAMLPMPAFGLHVAVYLTFAAAIVVATVRALSGAGDRLLTALLAWSGVFGLAIGAYFTGRSHPDVLIDLFSAWAFAVALLLVVVVRAVLARPSRRPTLPELAVVLAFCAMACSLAQVPTPWSQWQRIGDASAQRPVEQPEAVRLVRETTAPGERVLILMPLGHRIAERAGVVNVSPYSSIESMPTQGQLSNALDALRRSGGHQVFVAQFRTMPEATTTLLASGFRIVGENRDRGFLALSDDALGRR